MHLAFFLISLDSRPCVALQHGVSASFYTHRAVPAIPPVNPGLLAMVT
jgi:hypothetical protein